MTDPRIEKIARALAMLNVESDDNWKLYIQDAESALSAIGQVWQPIETAPKEGVVMVWCDVGVAVAYIGYHNDEKRFYDSDALEYGANIVRINPTHWMPLPEEPEIANA